jgi:drug/metabolite transporter (DMT)-like permease
MMSVSVPVPGNVGMISSSLFVAFLWGLATSFQKFVLQGMNPVTYFVAGHIFYTSCVVILAASKWHNLSRDIRNISLKTWGIIFFTVVVGGFCANLLYMYILKKHNSAIVAALTYSSPIFVLFISMYFLKEPIHFVSIIGILLAVFGVVLISYGSTIPHDNFAAESS